jgi:release factor glutamine methyltransferase
MNKQELLKQTEKLLNDSKLDIKLAKYVYEGLFNDKNKIDDDELKLYKEKIQCIINGMPPQYVIGHVNFYGYNFKVNKKVLIPRFETEELVYCTLEYVKKYFDNKIKILDIGTGSGVIAITLKKKIPDSIVYAIDISSDALKVAQENAKSLDVDINFKNGNMLESVKNQTFDIIIANLPYIRDDEEIEKIVYDNEPHIALFGGKDGLRPYEALFKDVLSILNDKFLIALEIADWSQEELEVLLKKYLKNKLYIFKKDMSSRTRMLFIFNNLD